MKKLKLLLSVSVMCLSLAVLCFGVFAAQSVTYSISGTISYTVSDAFVTVSTKVYKGSNQYTTDNALSTLANALAGGTQTLSGANFNEDSTYSISDYDSTSGQNFAQTINLTLSSTNKSYLVEMTITNLSPSVNVWAKASWSLTGSNVTQGNNTSQPTITKGTPQKIYFIVSIEDMTQSISSTSYTMQLDIGINDMPITATVDDTTVSSTYGTTWATFVSANSSTYSIDSNNYVLKGGEQLYYGSNKISSKSTIIDGAVYGTTVYGVVLTDDTKNQFYMNLGKYDGEPIRWNMVSADGTTKYNSDNYATDKANSGFISGLSGKAIFVQQSVSGGSVAFDAASTDYQNGYNNYYESDIRTNINTLSNWNLTESDVSTLISKRNITGIEAYGVDETYKYTGTTNDYFWLLSDDEVRTFLGTTTTDRE